VAPWLLALVQYTKATLGFDSNTSLGNLVLFGAAAVAGTVLQELGTFVEVRWDREREEALAVDENWFSYLSRTLEHEPVGYRYLSRLATTLYFELSMMVATPVFFAGATVLAVRRFPDLSILLSVSGMAALGISLAFFRWQARTTHETLCKTRRELNKRLSGGG
jgi:hypothetical protein